MQKREIISFELIYNTQLHLCKNSLYKAIVYLANIIGVLLCTMNITDKSNQHKNISYYITKVLSLHIVQKKPNSYNIICLVLFILIFGFYLLFILIAIRSIVLKKMNRYTKYIFNWIFPPFVIIINILGCWFIEYLSFGIVNLFVAKSSGSEASLLYQIANASILNKNTIGILNIITVILIISVIMIYKVFFHLNYIKEKLAYLIIDITFSLSQDLRQFTHVLV